MDDTLEIPRLTDNADEHSSEDEETGRDWTRLAKPGAAVRPVIPKRGEKDFEPAPGGGSGLQLHVLDRSRDAMFGALGTDRTISSKNISYGVWHPSIDRVQVTTACGIHFTTMGYSTNRTVHAGSKLPKRLELLPEEALYLVERGALLCYKSIDGRTSPPDTSNHDTHSPGTPMSVQQAFAEMIGRESITLERYQVYAYLKRLGFVLMRAEPPTPEYPVVVPIVRHPQTLAQRISQLFSCLVSRVVGLFHKIDWWKPLGCHRFRTTQDIFKALRFVPCGHAVPLRRPSVNSATSPYKIFFHVYKPSTPFRKTAPPPPDFHVVVVDARTTAVPCLQELAELFDVLPEMPLPPPRKRSNAPTPIKKSVPTEATEPAPGRSSVLWAFFWRTFTLFSSRIPEKTRPPPKPNPFPALKTGKKTVVIAAVDSGNISFFRFGQGAFEEWPMM